MKYKQGGVWIASTFIGWIVFTILDYFKPQLIDSILNIHGVSLLLIIDFIFLGIASFGFFLILKEKYGWFKKTVSTDSKQHANKKYDSKRLNDKVFRKLMRAELTHDYKGELTYEIPTDEMAFHYRKSNSYIMWITQKISNAFPRENYTSILHGIPELQIGEKLLEMDYPEVYAKWLDVKSLVDKHNQKYHEFLALLGKEFEKIFLLQFPNFVEQKKANNDDKNIYNLQNIQRAIFSGIEHSLDSASEVRFSILKLQNITDTWVISNNNYVLLASNNKENVEREHLIPILTTISSDQKIIEQFKESRHIDSELHDKLNEFQEHLEDDVVIEIDNLLITSSDTHSK